MKKLSTTSIILNVIASVIALLLLLASFGSLFELEILSAIFMLLAAIILSPLSKLIFKRQKTVTVRLIRVLGPIIMVAISSLIAQSFSEDTNNNSIVSVKDAEKEMMTKLKDSLNQVLEPKELTVCKIIEDLTKLEEQCIKDADKKYPNFDYPQHGNYTSSLIGKRTNKYIIKKKLDAILLDKVTIFSVECSEAERLANIEKLKMQKIQQGIRKEKIDKCYEVACSIVPDKIKASLHNPDSFKMVKCEYLGIKENNFRIRITYRGQNGFGAVRTEQSIATIDIETCNLKNIE